MTEPWNLSEAFSINWPCVMYAYCNFLEKGSKAPRLQLRRLFDLHPIGLPRQPANDAAPVSCHRSPACQSAVTAQRVADRLANPPRKMVPNF